MKDRSAFSVFAHLIRCPNPDCRQEHLTVSVFRSLFTYNPHGPDRYERKYDAPVGVGTFQFLPTTASPLSKHVPPSICDDYAEAYLIRDLSPKAAATLARRALQGMIRDFWKVAEGTLAAELRLIQDRCDPSLYEAMMALKAIGNIGAHPERDISLIIDIDPEETQQLLDLIHLLDAEWYVARANRLRRIELVKSLGDEKKPPKV